MQKITINQADLMPLEAFEKVRKEKMKDMIALKKARRLEVGPHATFFFENYDTIWWQIHEMLRIEKGGVEQEKDEIEAYENLVPNGAEFVATIMFEIENPEKRLSFLSKVGGIEHCVYLEMNGEKIKARAEEDLDRTSEDGKASSVQFVHFELAPQHITAFKNARALDIKIGFEHEEYPHSAALRTELHESLCKDLI